MGKADEAATEGPEGVEEEGVLVEAAGGGGAEEEGGMEEATGLIA